MKPENQEQTRFQTKTFFLSFHVSGITMPMLYSPSLNLQQKKIQNLKNHKAK